MLNFRLVISINTHLNSEWLVTSEYGIVSGRSILLQLTHKGITSASHIKHHNQVIIVYLLLNKRHHQLDGNQGMIVYRLLNQAVVRSRHNC